MHLKHYNLFLFVMKVLIFECMCIPQIYEEALNVCQYTIGEETLQVPRKTWSLPLNKQTLHFSICESLSTNTLCRGLHTSSCLVSKTENKVINYGNFTSGSDEANTLHSQNGDKCPFHDGLYKVIIHLECKSNTQINPTWKKVIDPCTFELTMMKPDCEIKCTRFVREGYFLDLRSFPKNLEVLHHDHTFKLTLCGTTNQCGPDPTISSCEILKNGSTVPLAKVESQSLHFDVGKNILRMSSKFKVGRALRQVDVLVKCNWEIEYSNVVYKKPPGKIGKWYKFELESSYGCVKLPPDCHVTGLDNLHYDLSKLYRPGTGFWNVSIPNGQIILNICGPLKLEKRNSCSEEYSQICEIQSKLHINRGSVLSHLEVIHDSIYGRFVYGAKCNTTTLHSTKIEFKCFKLEEGPVFQKYEDCVTYLLWKTPKACPVNYFKGNDCRVSGLLGNRNLQSLRSDHDHELILNPNAKLIYNLCGSLSQPCATFHHNVSFCLKTHQAPDVVLGWENKELISDKGMLKLDFKGSACNTGSEYGQVNVVFVCNFEDPPPKPRIEVLSNNCRFKLKVFTHLACSTDKIATNCTFTFGNTTYDLSPLVLRNKNYVVRDNYSSNIISLNLCGTVVSNTQALCNGDSMICMSKSDEINFSKKFLSLGSVTVVKPYLDENSNIGIKVESGSHCGESSLYSYYESVVYFECSTFEEGPKLLSVKPCVYYFLWKTRHVCRKKNTCLIPREKRDNLIPDLNLFEAKSLSINNITTYTFHLCNESYTRCFKDDCEIMYFKQNALLENQSVVFTLSELEKCNKNSVTKVVYSFICDREIEETSSQRISNCTLFEIIRSHLFCKESEISQNPRYVNNYQTNHSLEDRSGIVTPSTKEKFAVEETRISEPVNNNLEDSNGVVVPSIREKFAFEETRISEPVDNNPEDSSGIVVPSIRDKFAVEETTINEPVNNNCSFKHGDLFLNLTTLGFAQGKVGDSIYFVNFNKSNNCKGVVCRNNEVVVPFQSHCPKVKHNYTANTEEIFFDSNIACDQDFFKTKVSLGCIQTPIIIKDENCVLEIQINLRKLCNTNESVKYIVLGVFCLLIIVFLFGFFHFKRKKEPKCCSAGGQHEILLSDLDLEDKRK